MPRLGRWDLPLLAALALIGIPPLSGFWAKLMVLEAGIEHQAWWMISVVLLTSLLTFIPLMRIWFEAFWKAAPEQQAPAVATDRLLIAPVLALSAILLLIGLAPSSLIVLADQAAAGVLDAESYLRVVLDSATTPNVEIKL